MKTIRERLNLLSTTELEDLANALRYFCPKSVECIECPLCIGVSTKDLSFPCCLAIAADKIYFERIKEQCV